MGRKSILAAGSFAGMFLLAAAVVWADEPVTNETLLKEIRALKDTVSRQAQKIGELEKRVTSQEVKARPVGQPLAESEIDKKIDERLARKAPAYDLLEGLSLDVGSTTVVQASRNVNGDSQLSAKEDATSATVKVDIALDKQFGDYGEGFVYLKSGNGAGLDAKLKTFSTVNDSADDDSNVRLVEAWYEHKFSPMSGVLTFGKLDPTGYIDTNEYANDESIQFLGGMFVNSPVVDFSDNSPGLHLGVSPLEFLDFALEALDADGDGQDMFDAMFIAAQVNFKPKFLGKGGNYRFYAWQNNSNHMKWQDATKDKEKSHGYGLSFDQELTGIAGIFFRYGWQDPKVFSPQYDSLGALDWSGSVYSLKQSWSIGPQFKGTAWGRPDDVTGIAFGQIIPSDEYKNYYAGLSGAADPQAKSESRLEWYYNFKVNGHLSLSPDLQVIWRPFGKDAANGDGTIVVGGLRGRMDF